MSSAPIHRDRRRDITFFARAAGRLIACRRTARRKRPSAAPVMRGCSTVNAIVVDEAGFEKHLRDDDIPILVDMWAPWCGPCRTMAPMFERAAQVLEPEVRLLKLNVDEAQKTASRLGIRGIPALFLFRKGRVLTQTAGVQNTDAIVRWTRAQLASPNPPDFAQGA